MIHYRKLVKSSNDRGDVLNFYLLIDKETRTSRFNHIVSDSFIIEYCGKIFNNSILYGAYEDKTLIGLIELYIDNDHPTLAEIAVIVNNEYRFMGIGKQLFRIISIEAKFQGIKEIYTICTTRNVAMKKLAVDSGMTVRFIDGDYRGELELSDNIKFYY